MRDARWAFGAAFVLAALVVAWLLAGRSHPNDLAATHAPQGETSADDRGPREAVAPARSDDAAAPRGDGPVVDHTVRDRAVRDQIRRQIYVAWSRGAAPEAPRDPLYAPMPERDGGAVDPEYLRERIREDFLPMARQCYEHLLHRAPGAEGRTVVDFVVLGDEHVGGVVDEATLDDQDGGVDGGARDAGGLGDREFQTCLRESMMAMAFRPPPHGGRVRVRYPFRFAPDPDASTAR